MKEKGPFSMSVTSIREITKKCGLQNAEVNGLREKPVLAVENVKNLPPTRRPGYDHVISTGLHFAVKVKLNVFINGDFL